MKVLTRSHRSFGLCGLAVVSLAACHDVAPNVDDGAYESICPKTVCGANASIAGDAVVGELHLAPGQNTGQSNAWGVHVTDFIPPSGHIGAYTLRAENGRLIASNETGSLLGAHLVGARLLVNNTVTDQHMELRLHGYGTADSWTVPTMRVDRYIFAVYAPEHDGWVPLCKAAASLSDDAAWSVVLTRERYEWQDKRVLETGDDAAGWFNIACEGNGLYKMKMTGYEPDPAPHNPHVTAPEERQATLKMITADYCGTGRSFTETGTPLHWYNLAGWSLNAIPSQMSFEAYWDEHGAVCLDTPRLDSTVREAVLEECASVGKALQSCAFASASVVWESHVPAP